MIGVLDYGSGNAGAIATIYAAEGIEHRRVRNVEDLAETKALVVPGVGAFDDVMGKLESAGLISPLREYVEAERKPVLGICLGMQILFDRSEEGSKSGFGWIPGRVERIRAEHGDSIRVPHMGWNAVTPVRRSKLLEGLPEKLEFYFLHSYHAVCDSPDAVIAVTHYGNDLACAVQLENVFGVQFHPEKGHQPGERLLTNFARLECSDPG